MGAWGPAVFENDSAADWLAELPAALPQTLELTFRPVVATEPDLYLEEPETSEALAAAEVVAAMRGHPGEAVANNPNVRTWALDARDGCGPTWSGTRWLLSIASERHPNYETSGPNPRSSRVG
jgi:Domain of unknown function (DUF4259)